MISQSPEWIPACTGMAEKHPRNIQTQSFQINRLQYIPHTTAGFQTAYLRPSEKIRRAGKYAEHARMET